MDKKEAVDVTLWETIDLKTHDWVFNHLEYGHAGDPLGSDSKPLGSEVQTKAWAKQLWRVTHTSMLDGKVQEVNDA